MSNSASRENSGQRSRWLWFVVAGGLLITIIGLFLKQLKIGPPAQPGSADISSQTLFTGVNAPRALTEARARRPHSSSNSEPARTAKGIVAGKLAQFARSRREIVQGLARRAKVQVPDEVERFFDAVEAGDWDEINATFDAFHRFDGDA